MDDGPNGECMLAIIWCYLVLTISKTRLIFSPSQKRISAHCSSMIFHYRYSCCFFVIETYKFFVVRDILQPFFRLMLYIYAV